MMNSKRFSRLLIACFILLGLCTLVATYYFTTHKTFTIYDDGMILSVSGEYETVAEVLTAVNLTIRPEDILSPALTESAKPETAIQIKRAHPIALRTESETTTYWTHQPTLGAFLAENNIIVARANQIFADGVQVELGIIDQIPLPNLIEIGRFHTITIRTNEQEQTVRTATQTVGEALQEANVTLYAADGVTPPLDEWLTPDMVIEVTRSAPLTIHVDGRIVQTRSHHTNITDVLAEAGIGLVGFDYTRPSLETPLAAGAEIHVIRVTEDFRFEDEALPYQTYWQASDQLDLDTQGVISQGVPGILRRRIRIRYENGIEVSQISDGEWVARTPVNEVIGYGTRITIQTIDTPEGPLEYWRKVRMRVTSYTAASSGKSPDDPGYGITASGHPAGYGIVAVDRSVVPFRSYVYVPGYGRAFVGDTGGGVRGRWIDLGYEEETFVSWSGYVDVYYLTPVPAPEDINYLLPSGLP